MKSSTCRLRISSRDFLGLEAVLPGFSLSRTSTEDAYQVKIIHTNDGFLGYNKPYRLPSQRRNVVTRLLVSRHEQRSCRFPCTRVQDSTRSSAAISWNTRWTCVRQRKRAWSPNTTFVSATCQVNHPRRSRRRHLKPIRQLHVRRGERSRLIEFGNSSRPREIRTQRNDLVISLNNIIYKANQFRRYCRESAVKFSVTQIYQIKVQAHVITSSHSWVYLNQRVRLNAFGN